MKALGIILTGLMMSVTSFAFNAKNSDYAIQASEAAKAISSLNWGWTSEESFEVIGEDLHDDGVHVWGTYKVRLFIIDTDGDKRDGGKDFDVDITDGAVLNVKVDCRMCG